MGSPPSTSKSVWRRVAEVVVPVAVLAVATPLIVNGLAAAMDSTGSKSTSSTVAPATAGSTTTTLPTTATTSPATSVAPFASITIPGVDASTDDQTAALAGQIVAEVTPTTTSAGAAVSPTITADAGSTDPTTASTVATAGGHSHGGVVPEVALTRGERAELAMQLSSARTVAQQYPTVADAEAAGYTKVTGYVPLIGAHYIKWSLMDATFDVAQPEMLLYDGSDPTSTIVGLSYYMFSDTPPSPFAGPNDHWHQHVGLCMKAGVVVGGEQTTVEQCAARGGTKANVTNGWMVHAWVVPGWESPQGVFSPEHPGLTAELPTS